MKLHFSRQGQGAPLLLLHGLFGSGDSFLPIAKLLQADFDVICPDLRNQGRSPHGPSAGYGAMAQDLLELLDSLGLGKASLCGHSLGGKLAMRLALDQPSRVEKLAVADIAPRAYSPLFPEIFEALETLDLGALGSRTEADAALRPKIGDEATRGLLLKNLGRNESGGFYWKMNLKALAAARAELAEALAPGPPYPGPALFMKGELSPYILDGDWDSILKLFPSARLQILPGAGHWLHAEQPTPFAEALKNFLQEPS